MYPKTELPDLDDVLGHFWKNKIDRSVFIELNDEYLRELCLILRSRIKIHQLVQISTEPDPSYILFSYQSRQKTIHILVNLNNKKTEM